MVFMPNRDPRVLLTPCPDELGRVLALRDSACSRSLVGFALRLGLLCIDAFDRLDGAA
jgi:hypothetical protein